MAPTEAGKQLREALLLHLAAENRTRQQVTRLRQGVARLVVVAIAGGAAAAAVGYVHLLQSGGREAALFTAGAVTMLVAGYVYFAVEAPLPGRDDGRTAEALASRLLFDDPPPAGARPAPGRFNRPSSR